MATSSPSKTVRFTPWRTSSGRVARVGLDHVVQLEDRQALRFGGRLELTPPPRPSVRPPIPIRSPRRVPDWSSKIPVVTPTRLVGAVRVDDLDRVAATGQGEERGRRDGEHLVGGAVGDVHR